MAVAAHTWVGPVVDSNHLVEGHLDNLVEDHLGNLVVDHPGSHLVVEVGDPADSNLDYSLIVAMLE